MPEAYAALTSSTSVTVTTDNWAVFQPVASNIRIGFIVYPGGRVDFRSYAPLAKAIASQGYLVVIPKMPLNLAIFGVNTANDVINSYPQINTWVIGGHSLGGTMAAQFVYENPFEIQGLVLWAAYPASDTDLSNLKLSVTTIYGSNDGLVSSAQIDDSLELLPPLTVRVMIAGGNHAQFGWYGDQEGDNPATITREQQQTQILHATIALFKTLE
jgi:pimeloyl-ACP methyl ester carboxylesterase